MRSIVRSPPRARRVDLRDRLQVAPAPHASGPRSIPKRAGRAREHDRQAGCGERDPARVHKRAGLPDLATSAPSWCARHCCVSGSPLRVGWVPLLTLIVDLARCYLGAVIGVVTLLDAGQSFQSLLPVRQAGRSGELDSRWDSVKSKIIWIDQSAWLMVVARGGVEPPTFRFSVGRSYQLSYLAVRAEARPDVPVRPRRDSNPRPSP